MRYFNVTVSGKTYSVEIEEVNAGATPAPQTAVPATAPVAPVAAAPVQKAAPAGAKVLSSPLPGLILAVNVSDGQIVKKGDKIMVLEAMKMEHDIFASDSGKITLLVKKGDKVETGAQLASVQ